MTWLYNIRNEKIAFAMEIALCRKLWIYRSKNRCRKSRILRRLKSSFIAIGKTALRYVIISVMSPKDGFPIAMKCDLWLRKCAICGSDFLTSVHEFQSSRHRAISDALFSFWILSRRFAI
jgi:hypothetical protein